MYSYYFTNPQRVTFDSLSQDQTYLWIIHADKKPPHIGISTDGLFFSLKVKGKDENIRVEQLYSLLMKKRISFVLIQLNSIIDINEISCKFKQYRSAGTKSVTCLDPINKLLVCPEKVNILSDLLFYLEEKEMISATYLFGEVNVSGILKYSIEDIQKRLEDLENAERR